MTAKGDLGDAEIVVIGKGAPNAAVEPKDGIALGEWYWSKDPDSPGGRWLGCITHIGSNYAKLTAPSGGGARIHFDEFDEECTLEPNAQAVIDREIEAGKTEVRRLMAEVRELTMRLGVGQSTGMISAGAAEGAALAVVTANVDVKSYSEALERAKEKELPELFEQIKKANAGLSEWLNAETLPMKAQVGKLDTVIERINDRIFSVELYAGLTEQVTQITEGEPAAMTEKVRLLQRRHYMDEECLANYRHGGMVFKDMRKFDDWLATPENRDRILPFPRCIVAFQVRRKEKQRSLSDYISIAAMISDYEADKFTYLYIRNGERMYRLSTKLDFGEQLFPDLDHSKLKPGTKLYAKRSYGDDSVITENQYLGKVEDYLREKAEHELELAEYKKALAEQKERKRAAKKAKQKFDEPHLWSPSFYQTDPRKEYKPYDQDNVYFDDITNSIGKDIKQANRIALIIQGLLDRSLVLHPHPPWQLWNEASCDQALEMIYDDSRALVAGEMPDFEAYRKRLNETLTAGSITVGQRTAWSEDGNEEDEYGRKRRDLRKPLDPGPDILARVERLDRSGMCHYAWHREGVGRETYDKKIRVRYACSVEKVFNVDAYTPGDYKQFFADPRVRANYLQWAPFLLEAEEYHAGNRKVADPPAPEPRKFSYSGHLAYERRRARKRVMGKAVKLKAKLETTNGRGESKSYKAGTRWRVIASGNKGLTIREIDAKGDYVKGGATVGSMEPSDLLLDEHGGDDGPEDHVDG